MTKTIFLGMAITAAFIAGLLALMPVQEASSGVPSIGDDATERDNTTVTNIKLKFPQKLILVDNRGIVGGPASGTSDVEVTWRFDPDDCMVQWLPFGLDPSLPTSWVAFANDGAFGVFAAHDDALGVESVALSAKPGEKCKLKDDKGDFVTVSTVGSTP